MHRVAQAMRDGLRGGDREIFRYGGEEFAVVLDEVSPEHALHMAERLRQNKFTLTDYYDQLQQLKGMGSMEDIAGMLGMNAKSLKGAKVDEKAMARTEAIILSMTPKERENPGILGNSRKKRIAAGSGTTVVDVNRLLKQYDMMLQLVKQMSGNSRKMKKFAKMGGMPGMGGGRMRSFGRKKRFK